MVITVLCLSGIDHNKFMHSEFRSRKRKQSFYVSDFVISRSLIEDAMSEKMTQIDANFAYDHHSQSSSRGESSFACP
jgi:hypothetical protein